MEELFDLAEKLADEAGKIARKYFRLEFNVESKMDKSPVTIADREIEKKLRAILEEERPDDGIIGEEYGIKNNPGGYNWILDPIDGTKSFIIGRPTFGTLVALYREDTPVIGIIDQPILRERWSGCIGKTTLMNGNPVATRPCKSLADAVLATTDPLGQFREDPERRIYEKFCARTKTQALGGDCLNYAFLACGWVDMVIETKLKPHDFAALVQVVEGAGGMICDWEGNPLTTRSDGHVIALGNKSLWPEVSALLSE